MSDVLIKAEVEGLDETLRDLRKLDETIQRKVLRRSVYAGARLVRDKVKATAPVETGTIKRAVVHKFARELSKDGAQTYVVTLTRGKKYQRVGKKGRNQDAYYWPWVEYGHRIVARKGKDGGTLRARRRAATGSVPPHPFFEPAYHANRGEAERAIARRMEELIDEVTR